jgi:hypothetical protein
MWIWLIIILLVCNFIPSIRDAVGRELKPSVSFVFEDHLKLGLCIAAQRWSIATRAYGPGAYQAHPPTMRHAGP